MNPINNLTPRAQQVLALAQQEAKRLNHSYIGTEHLLFGLVKLGQGPAVQILTNLGVKLEGVQKQLEALFPPTPEEAAKPAPGFDAAVLLRDLATLVEKHAKR